MTELITLYDIPGTTKSNAWGPNTWKIRFVLNFKKIPYKTHWVEYPDIKSTFQKIGIEHTQVLPNGDLHFTVPAITDPTVSGQAPVHVPDSFKIAKYLDEKYPDAPLFPRGTESLQRMFIESNIEALVVPVVLFIMKGTYDQLNPESQLYFKETREKWFEKDMADWTPESTLPGALEKLKRRFDAVSTCFEKTIGREKECLFVMEDKTVYADLVLGAFLKAIKTACPDNIWPHIATWSEGRWDRFLTALEEKYGQVDG